MLKRNLKEGAFRVLAGMQVPELVHRRTCPRCLTIVMYHAVVEQPLPVDDWCFIPVERFTAQLEYLAQRFEVLPLAEAVDRLGQGAIERPTLAITFDDGFQNNHDVAFPILRRLGLPATMFLTTGLIGTDRTVWFCQLLDALARSSRPHLQWQGESLELGGRISRQRLSTRLQAALKRMPQPELQEEVSRIVSALGGSGVVGRDSPFRMLNPESVGTMARSGLIEFGAHTRTHAILSRLSEAEQREEIAASVHATEALAGQPCRLFAYPNGRAEDYDRNTVAILREHGITAAVTTEPGANRAGGSPWALKRQGIGADTSLSGFRMQVNHALPA